MPILSQVILRGLASAMPSASGVGAGCLYFATDTGAAYYSDGTNWDALTISSALPALTSEDVAFSGTAGTLSHAPTALLGLYRNGAIMSATSGAPAIQKYSISGANITLSVAAGTGDWFYAVYFHS